MANVIVEPRRTLIARALSRVNNAITDVIPEGRWNRQATELHMAYMELHTHLQPLLNDSAEVHRG